MKLYGGIDLHANNGVLAVLDAHDTVVYEKRVPNELHPILQQLAPYQGALEGLVVESTYNWYWLVDGLMEAEYRVHVAHTAALHQYEGRKCTNDQVDARWLAHLLRLGIVPEGSMYPKEERAVRDLLRKRAPLVRQKVTQMRSIQTLVTRNTGRSITANRLRQLPDAEVDTWWADRTLALAVKRNLAVWRCLETPMAS